MHVYCIWNHLWKGPFTSSLPTFQGSWSQLHVEKKPDLAQQFYPYPRSFLFLSPKSGTPSFLFSGLHFCNLQMAGTESLATFGKPKHYFSRRSDQISQRNLTMTDAISTEQFTIYCHRKSTEEGEYWQKSILFQANCFWDECQLLTL